MILDTIARSIEKRVERREQVKSLEQMVKAAYRCRKREGVEGDTIKRVSIGRENGTSKVHLFKAVLSKPGVSFICGVKKVSLLKGLIVPDLSYMEITRQYQKADTDTVSVLAESGFFLGADWYLEEIHREVELLLLRKDFIVDECQIYEAKILEAFAVLLIYSLMDVEKLERHTGIYDGLDLNSLAEAHTDQEVAMAAETGADIVGVNNRSLEILKMDFMNTLRLKKLASQGTILVTESGIRMPEDIELLAENQVNAVLVREILMRTSDKKGTLRELKSRIGQSWI